MAEKSIVIYREDGVFRVSFELKEKARVAVGQMLRRTDLTGQEKMARFEEFLRSIEVTGVERSALTRAANAINNGMPKKEGLPTPFPDFTQMLFADKETISRIRNTGKATAEILHDIFSHCVKSLKLKGPNEAKIT